MRRGQLFVIDHESLGNSLHKVGDCLARWGQFVLRLLGYAHEPILEYGFVGPHLKRLLRCAAAPSGRRFSSAAGAEPLHLKAGSAAR